MTTRVERMDLDGALRDWATAWTTPRRIRTPEEIETQRIEHEAETRKFAEGFDRLADLSARKSGGEYLTTDQREGSREGILNSPKKIKYRDWRSPWLRKVV